jgi:hypothetical protein
MKELFVEVRPLQKRTTVHITHTHTTQPMAANNNNAKPPLASSAQHVIVYKVHQNNSSVISRDQLKKVLQF